MPAYPVHLRMDRFRFGKEFPQVHKYMDRAWKDLGVFHRSVGHDQKTIDEIRSMWGDEAAEAARWHLRDDWNPFLMLASSLRYIPEVIYRRLSKG